MSRRVVPVSTLIRYLKQSMDSDPVLHGVMIEGEISNFRRPYSGHWYFSLKDEKASLACVMFASSNRKVAFSPKSGDKVILKGDVSVYEPEGRMQMIAAAMQPSGIGDLYIQLEALKKKLNAEGLFRPEHKKPLKRFPMDIALVTGNNTAAREDVLITLKKRWPAARLTEYPCPVQGAEAAGKIIQSLLQADTGNHDVILLVRGGGSLEDLWCFNDEQLARTIYAMNTPVVTGVGHETDTTIADYVSDLRANTPTGAVEAAVPDAAEVMNHIRHLNGRMQYSLSQRLRGERARYEKFAGSQVFSHPEKLMQTHVIHLQYLDEKLHRYHVTIYENKAELSLLLQRFRQIIAGKKETLSAGLYDDRLRLIQAVRRQVYEESGSLSRLRQQLLHSAEKSIMTYRRDLASSVSKLDSLSPLKVLERGYSIVMKDGHTVSRTDEISNDDLISIRISDGLINAVVTSKEEMNGREREDI